VLAVAPGVELLGPMAGSGYRTPPVLVRRPDGQVVQLTPLLAAVLAAADGQRDAAAIADYVAAHHGRALHPDDAAQLLRRLVPLGLVVRPGQPASAARRADPLLGLRGRVRLVSAERTHALTGPFLWLFRPAVVVAVLAAFAAGSAWALLRHGLGTAVDEAIADPALLLGVVALIVASASFHELGHATACRYGGARPGAMGAAIYLVWPAFYTDVTDSYRLDRVGRLRVDLGGLYFNAVFTVVTMATWLATGTEALLVLVPVQLLQMVRQLVPLVRFDGYHVLADLVGVPDLFARIRPTVRRWLPGGRRLGPSPLTRRAQAVVVAWVAAVVPVLAVTMGMLLWHLPGIVTSALRSLRLQGALFAENLGAGHLAAAALGVVGMATVAFLPASAAYLAARVSHRGGRRWWRLTEGRPVLRAAPAAALVVALVVAGPGLVPRPPAGPATDLAGAVVDGEVAELAAGPTAAGRLAPLAVRPAPPAPPASEPGPVHQADAVEAAPATVAEPAAAEPVAAEAPLAPTVRPAWPFSFQPPAPPRPGDNRAMAVNVVDGRSEVAWATSLRFDDDGLLDQRNEAWALAECVGCRTLAVAFQVVAGVGDVPTVVPQNLAVAHNEACDGCRTTAIAVQLAVTLDELPPPEVRAQLRRIVARVEGLQGTLRDATPGQIHAALDAARDEAMALLEPYLSQVPQPEPEPEDAPEADPAPTDPTPEDGTTTPDGTIDPAGSPAPEGSTDPDGSAPDDATTPAESPAPGEEGTAPADADVAAPPPEDTATAEPTAGEADADDDADPAATGDDGAVDGTAEPSASDPTTTTAGS